MREKRPRRKERIRSGAASENAPRKRPTKKHAAQQKKKSTKKGGGEKASFRRVHCGLPLEKKRRNQRVRPWGRRTNVSQNIKGGSFATHGAMFSKNSFMIR